MHACMYAFVHVRVCLQGAKPYTVCPQLYTGSAIEYLSPQSAQRSSKAQSKKNVELPTIPHEINQTTSLQEIMISYRF